MIKAPEFEPPVGWLNDRLSGFFQEEIENRYATFVQNPELHHKLANIDDVFYGYCSKSTDPKNLVSASLIYRCHSAFRAASSLATAGHGVETMTAVRMLLEMIGYAAYIHENEELTKLWLNRHTDDQTRERMKREFTIRNVKGRLRKLDVKDADVFDILYERAIDFGAHPNPQGVLASLDIIDTRDGKKINTIYLHGGDLTMMHSIKTVATAGVCAIRIASKLYYEEFENFGLMPAIRTISIDL
ncbi:MAG: hypothetical protein GC202_11335 [Alphaproteobacteria bacterium]|nr:hypothetical protein [Alphaproteobacteria bacterium]